MKMHWRKIFVGGVWPVAFLGLTSCSSLAAKIVEKPKVNLEKVGVKSVTGDGAIVLFGVGVENPNPFAIQVDALHYDIELGGKPFGAGKIDQAASVAAHAKTVVDIPVPVRFNDIFSSMMDLITNKSSTYRIKGEAEFGLLHVPFDEKGEFKIRE